MQQDRKDKKKELKKSTFSTIEKMHPYKMLLYLVILGSTFLFLFLVLAFNISQPFINKYEYLKVPKAYVISTIILLLSSFQISKLVAYYKTDNLKALTTSIGITLILSAVFIVVQYIGWIEISNMGGIFVGMINDSYLYVIVGLHIFHFLTGLFFLGYSYYNLMKVPKDPVYSLLLFTNPFEKMKLELLVTYWHFINILWMATFFYFLFTF